MDYKSLKYLDLLLLAYRNGKKIWQMHLQSYFKKYYIIHKNDHEIFKKKHCMLRVSSHGLDLQFLAVEILI